MLSATIAITTMNRREDLRTTLGVLRNLSPQPIEILVCLDGSSDGSAAMIRSDFPEVTLFENRENLGSVPSRDMLFRRAKGDLIVSLDDDSYPLQTDFLQLVSNLVAKHPEAGAFTFVEVRDDAAHRYREVSSAEGTWVSAYPNCAGVIRRNLYGNECTFPRHFIHMYEETDFAIQLYSAGWAVWFEPGIWVRHHYSPIQRNERTRAALNARNEFWSVLMRCPFPQMMGVGSYRVLRQLAYACPKGWSWIVSQPGWWVEAAKGWRYCARIRRPAPWRIYWNWMRLTRKPAASLVELYERFPSIPQRLSRVAALAQIK